MAFNFERYTSNNPLLQEIEEEVTAGSSGIEMGQGSKYPKADLEQAIFNAKSNGVKKDEALYYIELVYGKDTDKSQNYTSAEKFDTMSNDELDNAGFTGDKDLGPNK